MHVETALKAIDEWFGPESHQIMCVTSEATGSIEDFEQSETFISVRGEQYAVGMDGDCWEGIVYFEFEPGKYIKTQFWC